MKNLRTLPALGAAALLALAACSDAPTSAPAIDDRQDELARQVAALGFRGDMVKDFGDYVLVEGDIYLTKAQLAAPAAPPRSGDPLSLRFQYRTTNLVGSPKVNQITVNLAGLASEPGWQLAAQEALTHWSGISNSYVRLTETTGAADISVGVTCTSSNVAAYASFPSGGNPGSTIYVNSCFAYATSHAQKLHNMVHEFGHTLGFRHSNYVQMGESAGTEGAVHVPNTPTSGNDPGSVMNGGTALNSWAGFSAGDLTAARTLYPVPPPPATVAVTNSGGYPLISWVAVPGATSYTVRLVTTFFWTTWRGDTSRRSFWETKGTTTGTSFLDTSRTYSGEIHCTWPADYPYGPNDTYTEYYEYAVVAQLASGTSTQRVYAPVGECY